jgi:hypothetical protein
MEIFKNKNLWVLVAIATIVILFFVNGCHQRNLGRKEVLQTQKTLHTEKELKIWKDSVENLSIENSQVYHENGLVKLRNEDLLKSLSAYQMHQATIRSTNVDVIKEETDSTKDKQIDKIQLSDKNGLLIDYANYTNLSNSYDSCQQEKKILHTTINSDSITIKSDRKLLYAKDSLDGWKEIKLEGVQDTDKKIIRSRTWWIVILGVVNAAKDALVIDYFLKH